MNQIKPYPVWLGHVGDGRAIRALFDEGIRAIVQLAVEEAALQLPRELVCLRIPLVDGADNDPDLLCLSITSVALLIESNVPTLVCCSAGMSRSPAVVAGA